MKFLNQYCVYDLLDEERFTHLEKTLAKEARVKTHATFSRLCDDFGINRYPMLPVYFFNGEAVRGTELAPVSFGFTNSGMTSNFGFFAEIYISLPHLVAISDEQLDDTIPHEVAHAFANFIYSDQCHHDSRWQEVMQYLNLPTDAESWLSIDEKNNVLSAMKFYTTDDAIRWAKGEL